MAIVTISQIKHRRGIKGTDPMPQLASAELGWAVDEQGLYIGNGTIAEGAPAVGNTEILTEHSSLALLLSEYTYGGPFVGATGIQTGPGAGSPVERPQDDRLDDNVNVRSYGAPGISDAITLAALDRAIAQHAGNGAATNNYWTTIYVPAGTYDIDGPLQLPSRTRLVGDGYNSTIINRTNVGTVLEIVEGVEDVYISGIGFTTADTDSDVARIIGANNVLFDRVSFNGLDPNTLLPSNQQSCVTFSESGQPATAPTYNIKFVRCLFTGNTYGITSGDPLGADVRQDISNVVVENCLFDDLYKAIVVGQNADITTTTAAGVFEIGTKYKILTIGSTDFTLVGAASSTVGLEFTATGVGAGTGTVIHTIPSAWRVSLSIFDNITHHGIHCFKAKQITSGMNHFANVGNLQATTPTTPNIAFGDTGTPVNPLTTALDLTNYENCYSIGDTFDRTDADDLLFKRVTTNAMNSYSITPFEIFHGSLHVEPGRLILLANGVTAATGIALDNLIYQGAIIDYQINRGVDLRRTGTLTLTIGTIADGSLMDDFVETSTPTGVTFTAAFSGGVATINHTTTGGTDAVFSYSIRHLTNVLALPV